MGNVQQEAAFGVHQGGDAARHAVECARQLAQFVAARGAGTRRQISPAEALHGLLQGAHRAGEMVGQPVAEQHRGHQKEQVLGGEEPGSHRPAGHLENEAVAPVFGSARHGGAGHSEEGKHPAAAGTADQGGLVLVGQQIASGLVGEDPGGVVNALEGIEEGLQTGPAAGFVSRARLLQFEGEQMGGGRFQVGCVAPRALPGDERRAHQRNRQRTPEPQQDLGKQRVHSPVASSGVRLNW